MDAYQLALDQGRRELEDAQRQQRILNLRVSQLEAIVTQLQAFISKGVSQPGPLFEAATEQAAPDAAVPTTAYQSAPTKDNVPLWKAILNSLNGMKEDFTVPDAVRALERTGRIIESRNRLNIVRNTLIHKEDIFGRLGTGHYYVKGYEKRFHELPSVKDEGKEIE